MLFFSLIFADYADADMLMILLDAFIAFYFVAWCRLRFSSVADLTLFIIIDAFASQLPLILYLFIYFRHWYFYFIFADDIYWSQLRYALLMISFLSPLLRWFLRFLLMLMIFCRFRHALIIRCYLYLLMLIDYLFQPLLPFIYFAYIFIFILFRWCFHVIDADADALFSLYFAITISPFHYFLSFAAFSSRWWHLFSPPWCFIFSRQPLYFAIAIFAILFIFADAFYIIFISFRTCCRYLIFFDCQMMPADAIICRFHWLMLSIISRLLSSPAMPPDASWWCRCRCRYLRWFLLRFILPLYADW